LLPPLLCFQGEHFQPEQDGRQHGVRIMLKPRFTIAVLDGLAG
jgi:hypothetical protein